MDKANKPGAVDSELDDRWIIEIFVLIQNANIPFNLLQVDFKRFNYSKHRLL